MGLAMEVEVGVVVEVAVEEGLGKMVVISQRLVRAVETRAVFVTARRFAVLRGAHEGLPEGLPVSAKPAAPLVLCR